MAHLNPDEPKHSLDSNSQSGKEDACTKQIIQVIKNQMIDRFRCEQKEMLNISTGCIADSEDLLCAREKGSEALAAVKTTGSEKVTPLRLATEESAVVRNLHFVLDLDLDAEKKVEVFSHEWTSCPSSLFEAVYHLLKRDILCAKEIKPTTWLQYKQLLVVYGYKRICFQYQTILY